MSLDRQQILSELGSVMNQLQSADCGCMGKLFNEGNQGGGGGGGHHGCRGCCHGHGCGHFAGGDPSMKPMNPCMGRCNPPKLFADTYSYLNQNLMKPVVNEVYEDLRSLTPDNTIMNNPMGAKMGLMQGGGMQGKPQTNGGSPMDNGGMGQMQGMPQMYGGSPMDNGGMGQMQGRPQMYGGSPMDNGGMGQMQGRPQMYGGSPMDNGGMGQMQGRPQMYGGSPMDNGGMGQMQGRPQMYEGTPMDQGGMGQMQGRPQMYEGTPMDNGGMGQMQSGQMGNQHMNQMMAGMGPQIVQMMNSASRKSPNTKFGGQGGVAPTGEMMQPGSQDGMQNSLSMQNDMSMQGTPMQNTMPSSEMGMQNAMPTSGMPMQNAIPTSGMGMQNAMPGMNQGEHNLTMAAPAMHNSGFRQPQNPATQQNMGASSHNEQMGSHFNLRQGNVNPRAGYTTTNNTYGAHTQGMRKFNEMFPGIMNGELGFDPMAIAMQMNPANHRKMAMDTMNKMMMGKGRVDPALASVQATSGALAQQGENQAAQGALTPQGVNLQNMPPGQQIGGQQGMPPTQMMQNPQGSNAGPGNTQGQMPQQQVYTALTGAPNMEQPPQQLTQQELQAYQQQQNDPNTGAVMQENAPEETNPQIQHQQELLYKEPIFPVDTSKNNRFAQPVQQQQQMKEPQQQRIIEYNLFGQPVELVNADLYKPAPIDPNEPMTLYPSAVVNPKLRNDVGRFYVKNTVSKTSLMGNKLVVKTPSRSQMQQIYNQYKGSQSYTQQNIPIQNDTHSERRLQQQQRQVPVERVGGDTAANNQVNNAMPMKGEPVAQMGGDVPQQLNKPQGDNMPLKEPPRSYNQQPKTRNGLQDIQFSNYQHNSQAWSFHGDHSYRPALRRGRVH